MQLDRITNLLLEFLMMRVRGEVCEFSKDENGVINGIIRSDEVSPPEIRGAFNAEFKDCSDP